MAFRWQWRANSIGKPRWCGWMNGSNTARGMIALAPKTGTLYYVAFVDRGRARRIISLRRANRREVKHYVQTI